MKYALLIVAALSALCHAQDAEFVIVTPEGLSPEGAVATVSDLSSNAVVAVAAAAVVEAASNTVQQVFEMVGDVTAVVNALESVGYIKGYMLDFGVAGTEPSTNATATIIYFEPAVSNSTGYVYCDIYTYFSETPATWPVARWSTSPRDAPEWQEAVSVSVVLTNRLVNETLYDCYRNTVQVDESQTNAFFRIMAEAQQMQTGAYLPVRNGIRVGGMPPATFEVVSGTNVYKWVGGVRVIPQ
jgi:hypothetical protein